MLRKNHYVFVDFGLNRGTTETYCCSHLNIGPLLNLFQLAFSFKSCVKIRSTKSMDIPIMFLYG